MQIIGQEAIGQICEIIRYVSVLLIRLFVIKLRNLHSEVAAARVYDQPIVLAIFASYFYEMISSAECSDAPSGFIELNVSCTPQCINRIIGIGCIVGRFIVNFHARRDAASYYFIEFVQIGFSFDLQFECSNTASDIFADHSGIYMNMQAMLKQAQALQKDMLKIKNEIDSTEFIGESSLVKVTLKGTKEAVKVEINLDEDFDKEDLEALEDMIVLAINDANKKIDAMTEKKMGKFGNIPGLF